jgi:hypothetical protein
LVARAVETDDETIANQLVAADAGDRRQILDALGASRKRARDQDTDDGCEHYP